MTVEQQLGDYNHPRCLVPHQVNHTLRALKKSQNLPAEPWLDWSF